MQSIKVSHIQEGSQTATSLSATKGREEAAGIFSRRSYLLLHQMLSIDKLAGSSHTRHIHRHGLETIEAL